MLGRQTSNFPRLVLGFLIVACVPQIALAVQARTATSVREDQEFHKDRAAGKRYFSEGKATLAIPLLQKARALNFSDFDNGYDLAVAYKQTGQLDKARAEARRLLKIRDTADVHTLLGDIETAAHSNKAAAAEYQIAANMDPSEDRIFDFGRSLLIFGSDAAIRIFSYGAEKYPKSVILRIGLGEAFNLNGQYGKAAEVLCQAMDVDPDDARPIGFLEELPAVSSENSKQIDLRLLRFLKTHPDNAKANYYRARNLLNPSDKTEPSKGDMATGERLLRNAIRLNPQLAGAHYELGWLFERESRPNDASLYYEHAVKLDPSQKKYHYRLWFVYRAMGKTEKAEQQFRAFQRLRAAEVAEDARDVVDELRDSHH
jgi:tetratricopeptide (TPR) repeat protein